MTVRFVLAVIFLLISIPLFAVGKKTVNQDDVYDFRKVSLATFGASLFFLVWSCIRVVAPGQVAIPVAFGTAGSPVGPGIHFVNPLASVERMSIRTEGYTMSVKDGEGNKTGDDSVSVLGSDGAEGSVDATVLFHLQKASASKVYRELGTGYVEKLVRPTIRTCIRNGFATQEMVVAATTRRSEVADTVRECIDNTLNPHGIVLEQFQLRDIHLGKEVQGSIDRKVTAQQQAEQQRFELQTAQQKAEIARVDAQGKADSQQIIACGGTVQTLDDGSTKVVPNTGDKCQNTLSDAYLQYLYIQTLQATVDSENHSTVILPFDQNLTPLLNVPAGG